MNALTADDRIQTVAAEAAGTRLDQWLADAGRAATRSAAQKLIAAGLVNVNGSAAKKGQALKGGERIELLRAPPISSAPDQPAVPFSVVYEDSRLLVVDKPAGLVVHPAAGHRTGTLSQALAGRAGGGDPGRPGIVHRLDRDTSGLLVVARDDAALRFLQDRLRERAVTREYLALVDGRPASRSGTIDAPLGRDSRRRTRMSVQTDKPRESVTHFETEEALPLTTLLRVRLETGRTHQIRAHLHAIGLEICGDPEYGRAGRLGLNRQFLHAARLAFPHPDDNRPMSFESPLPADLEAALQRARAEAATADQPGPAR